MGIFYKKTVLGNHINDAILSKKTIGLVPTMGALHKGHLALVEKALSENDLVIVSIFVNPTQFDNENDLKKYPRTLDDDSKKLWDLDKNILVYAPLTDDIYGNEIKAQKFNFDGLEYQMEGKFRQGHFDGVGTIVKKFLEITTPHKAYFGEKDFQQLQIIKKLVEKHQIPVTIVPCKIHREENGLAMSSRNERLSALLRNEASFIYKTLKAAKIKFGTKSAPLIKEWVTVEFQKNKFLELEYIEIAEESTLETVKRKQKNKKYRAFIAVYANDIRLIDNIALN